MSTIIVLLAIALSAACASADYVYELSSNDSGLSGSIGTVDVSVSGYNPATKMYDDATVTVTLNKGYEFRGGNANAAVNVAGGMPSVSKVMTPSDWTSTGAGTLGGYGDLNQTWTSNSYYVTSAKFHLTSSTGWADESLVLSGNNGGYFAGVHFWYPNGTPNGKIGFAAGNSGMHVPEPGTLMLLGLGLLGLAAWKFRST